jgi:hypothetical protein
LLCHKKRQSILGSNAIRLLQIRWSPVRAPPERSSAPPADEELLHATFFGTKLPNADVENLLLYNIDSFANAGRNGIRIEYDTAVPPAPDGGSYRFCYRYGLVRRSSAFNHWNQAGTLASFDWTDLGDFAGAKKLEQVWLALARSRDEGLGPTSPPGTPFGVKVQIQSPRWRRAGVSRSGAAW